MTHMRSIQSTFIAGAIALGFAPLALADLTALTLGLGGDHTCAVTPEGGVKCWGLNNLGQLGDGSTLRKWTPVQVVGLTSGIAAVTAGSNHSCALTAAGGLKCWGANTFSNTNSGQLGDGTFIDRSEPVDVVGLSSGVKAVRAGGNHTCAIVGSGVKCWGRNLRGLGDGVTTLSSTPVSVANLTEPVVALSTGSGHDCVLLQSGNVMCWGANDSGQLGNASTAHSPTPVAVLGLGGPAVGIATGSDYTCAVLATGAAKCWGQNRYGQLGDGSNNFDSSTWMRLTPVPVLGLSSGVASIDAGMVHTCARTIFGGVKCWGTNNFYGAIGNGGSSFDNTVVFPADVTGLTSGVTAVFSGYKHTCALTTNRVPRCWGSNFEGAIGSGAFRGAVRVPHLGVPDYQVATGIAHTLVVTSFGEVWGWGDNTSGKLGNGTTARSVVPVRAAGLTNVVAVAAGMDHSLALKSDGTVWAWGLNDDGQLGLASSPATCTIVSVGPQPCARTPVQVPGLVDVVAVAAGWRHSLALISDGTVMQWGNQNLGGQPGQPGSGSSTPTLVPSIGFGVRIAAGYMHSAAVESNDNIYVWGRGDHGELGPSTTSNWTIPRQYGFGTDVSAGGAYTIKANDDGILSTWGMNAYGTLGDPAEPTSDGSGFPVYRASASEVVGIDAVTAFSAGFGFAFARTLDGNVYSWGLNTRGQLGNGGAIPNLCGNFNSSGCVKTPTRVAAHDGALRLEAGGAHTFTGRPGGSFVLFGDNSLGQLGNANTNFGASWGQFVYDPDGNLSPASAFGSGASVGLASTDGITLDSVDGGVGFGLQSVGNLSGNKTLTLKNVSGSSIQVQSVSTIGDFVAENLCPSTLTSGASCTVNVRFWPNTAGPQEGMVTIATSLADAPFISIALNGSGVGTPSLVAVRSRKLHGPSGWYDMPIDMTQPIGGAVTVEPRSGGHAIVFHFDMPIASAGTPGSVDAGAIPIGSASATVSGQDVVVTLSGIPNGRRVTVSLGNVNGSGLTVAASLAFLAGDINRSRTMTASDILAAKGRAGELDGFTYLYDVDLSGWIDPTDIGTVRAGSGLVAQ